jgi:lipoate-protein ligase A
MTVHRPDCVALGLCTHPRAPQHACVRLLPRLLSDGPTQMAIDEALLECVQEPTLRTYAWQPPCVSLGYFQDFASVRLRLATTQASGEPSIPLVRRITGGGAIWHDREITYCLVAELGRSGVPARVRDLYPVIHGAIRDALGRRGIQVDLQGDTQGDRRYADEPRCFASPATDDLVFPGGGKVLGSAGRVRSTRVLVHGSLKLSSNPWDGAVVRGCGLDVPAAADLVEQAISAALSEDLHADQLHPAEEQACARIKEQRYATPEWVQLRRGPRP